MKRILNPMQFNYDFVYNDMIYTKLSVNYGNYQRMNSSLNKKNLKKLKSSQNLNNNTKASIE